MNTTSQKQTVARFWPVDSWNHCKMYPYLFFFLFFFTLEVVVEYFFPSFILCSFRYLLVTDHFESLLAIVDQIEGSSESQERKSSSGSKVGKLFKNVLSVRKRSFKKWNLVTVLSSEFDQKKYEDSRGWTSKRPEEIVEVRCYTLPVIYFCVVLFRICLCRNEVAGRCQILTSAKSNLK